MLASLGAAALSFPVHPLEAQTLPSGFTRSHIAQMAAPTRMAFAPDGRIFVAEKDGRLLVIKNGALLSAPFLTVTVDTRGERGLEGVVLDPNFATNHYIYIYYSATTPTVHNRVSRITANGDVALAGSDSTIIELDPLRSDSYVHNGGDLKFSPDGMLLIATGENATSSNAPNLSSLLGKILKIDPRSDDFPADANRNYSIPSSNPFRSTVGARPEIWAYGLRNPFSIAIQPGTNRLFINDVGSYAFEEINEGFAGANYGWPATEGPTSDPRFRPPLFAYNRNTGDPTGCAITGGDFYNPKAPKFPNQYLGKYFFTDYCGTWIYYLDLTNLRATQFATGLGQLDGLTIGPEGNLYYLLYDDGTGIGGLYKISHNGVLAPQISIQPTSQLVSAGYAATYTVSANGDNPLTYQWQRNGIAIAGATSPTYTIPGAQFADNGALFRCVITNSWGTVVSRAATLSVTTKLPPTPVISAPFLGSRYNAGDIISFAGSASDPQDGNLSPAKLTWEVLFQHHAESNPNHHSHPFLSPVSGLSSGTFKIPTSGEVDLDVWYRIFLTAVDSFGLVQTTFRDLLPNTSQLYLATNPVGAKVTVDGAPRRAPLFLPSVVNVSRTIGVDTPQTLDGLTYDFYMWSDNGARVHSISTPPADRSYVASFWKRAGYGTITANPNPVQVTDGSRLGVTTVYWSSAQTKKVEVHVGSPSGNLLTSSPAGSFAATTGKWVREGTVFYLQDVTAGQPLTPEFTLDTVTLHLGSLPTGSITADPNPLITDPFGLGVTNVSWTSYDTKLVDVRINAPDGPRLSGSGPGSASAKTGLWAVNGMTFYLQNISDGLPLTSANTLATATLVGAGKLTLNPDPIFVTDGSTLGVTTVSWSTFGTTAVEVHIGSPSGPQFGGSNSGTASVMTGKWVKDGMSFYLQDVSNGKPLTAANTLASAVAHVRPVSVTTSGSWISAYPNPISSVDGVNGHTTLYFTTNRKAVEVHVNAPNGPQFTAPVGSGRYTATTGDWVSNGMKFYLQDVSNGAPLSSINTLGIATVGVDQPTATLTAQPDPITGDVNKLGVATLSGTSTLAETLEIHVGAPNGVLFARFGPGPFSYKTGIWVTNGMTFYLQNVSGGLPLTSVNTLATAVARVTTN